MYDYKTTPNVYIVHSKKNGNEFSIGFNTLDEVANYAEKEENVTGVWKVSSIQVPPDAYKRRKKDV